MLNNETSLLGQNTSELCDRYIDKQSRIIFPDVLRIIAILMVVLVHISSKFLTNFSVTQHEYYVANIINSLSRAGVPIFVMVSGIFMLDENKNITIKSIFRKNIKNIIILYIIWSVAFGIINNILLEIIAGNPFSLDMIKAFIYTSVFGYFHMWYLVMIVGLYMITPLLRLFVKAENAKYIGYFLILSLLFQFLSTPAVYLIKEYTNINFASLHSKLNLNYVYGYTFYYILGWYIYNIGFSKLTRMLIYISGIIGIIIMIAISYDLSMKAGEVNTTLYHNLYIFTCVYAVSIFLGIYSTFNRITVGHKFKKLVNQTSRLTFGVYIIHVLVLKAYELIFPYSVRPTLYMIMELLVATTITFIVVFIMSKIPYVKKLIRG